MPGPGPGLRFEEREEISWRRDRGEGARAIARVMQSRQLAFFLGISHAKGDAG